MEWVVITLDGEIDLSRVEEIDVIFQSQRPLPGTGLIIDLSPVTFMDSSGIGLLMRAEQHLLNNGSWLTLVIPKGPARRLIEVAGLADRWPSYPTLHMAIESCNGKLRSA